jgi:hypothetical protein
MMNSCRSAHFTFSHDFCLPETYGALASFEMIPSSPLAQACA